MSGTEATYPSWSSVTLPVSLPSEPRVSVGNRRSDHLFTLLDLLAIIIAIATLPLLHYLLLAYRREYKPARTSKYLQRYR